MRRLAASAAAVLAFAVPTPSSARTMIVDEHVPAGPVLAGQGLVWVERSLGRFGVVRRERVRHLRPDGSTRTLHQFDRLLPRHQDRELVLAASGSHVIVAVEEHTDEYDDTGEEARVEDFSRAQAARLDGPAVDLQICRNGSESGPLFAIDGSIAAYLHADCERVRGALRVRDLAGGPGWRIAPPPGRYFSDLVVAGRFVLAHTSRTIGEPERAEVAVHDARSGRRLLRFAGVRGLGPNLSGYDVARDGTLVASYPTSAEERVHCRGGDAIVRLKPARPRPERLPGEPCDFGPLLMRDWLVHDRLVTVIREGPPGPAGDVFPLTQLVARHLPSGTERILTEPAYGATGLTENGRSALVTMPACGFTARATLLAVDELLARPPLRAERCTAEVTGTDEVRVTARGDLELPLSCPRGCVARVQVWLPSEGRFVSFAPRDDARADALVTSRYRGERYPLEARLAKDEAEALRATRSRNVEVQIAVTQLDRSLRTTKRAMRLVAAG